MARTRHFSYYINVPQTLGVILGAVCLWRWIKMEEAKALQYNRSLVDICKEDIAKLGIFK